MKQATTVLIAVGALLAGGIATAAFMNHRNAQPEPVVAPALAPEPEPTPALATDDAPAPDADQVELEAAPVLQYAQIVKVDPVTQRERLYATVIGTEPVRETTHTTVPKEVCEDVVVQERLPEKDGNVGGTVAGAVIGGLLGNQVGGGSGKKAATAAGAIAGGVIGNKVDKDKERGQVVTRTERQCHMEDTVSESSKVTGYNVTYRNADGLLGENWNYTSSDGNYYTGDTSWHSDGFHAVGVGQLVGLADLPGRVANLPHVGDVELFFLLGLGQQLAEFADF